ncbi:MCE family protein [Actinomadura rayongensis]|uniref:MCE family protein n=1 Tax=Actinomadura rayongensis TaxID=1429076 RepID=A0A6I4W2C5_9ACTN|nr:MCE family protein [Actinomadura rayongensis]
MILKRGVKFQLLVFAVITVVGVSIVAVKYIGFGRGLLGKQYTAYVDLTDSGGVFTNAEVTYRGVPVGRVGPIELTRDGIRVKLVLERQKGREIPREGLRAIVANRSAIGEQYIDLQPSVALRKGVPTLDQGRPYTIPKENTALPVSTADLLRNVNQLVSSVDPKNLGTIVDELDKAFAGSATDLQKILDDTDRLIDTANQAYPDTKKLLENGRTVLDTQRSEGANIEGFARNLNTLTAALRKDDPALRGTIDAVPGAVSQTDKLISGLDPTLPVLLANLTTTGQIITSRANGLRSLLILYPVTLAGASTVMPGDGTQHMGLELNFNSPPVCEKGYTAKRRWPQDTSVREPDLNAGCKLPKSSQSDVRGTRNIPQDALLPYPKVPAGATDGAGFPAGGATGGTKNATGNKAATSANTDGTVAFAGYDPTTGTAYGPDGTRYTMPRTAGVRELGEEASWKWLLVGPLSQS